MSTPQERIVGSRHVVRLGRAEGAKAGTTGEARERHTQVVLPVRQFGGATGRNFEPFLVINGMIIPVEFEAPKDTETLIGRQVRTFNGRMRSGIRRRMRGWHIVTPFLPFPRAHEIYAMLRESRPPLSCDGRIFYRNQPVRGHVGPIGSAYSRSREIDPNTGIERDLMSLDFDLFEEG